MFIQNSANYFVKMFSILSFAVDGLLVCNLCQLNRFYYSKSDPYSLGCKVHCSPRFIMFFIGMVRLALCKTVNVDCKLLAFLYLAQSQLR